MDNVKLQILLIGPPLVTYDGKPVKISRQQPRALLYYLAAQTQPASRDELCELFWPGEQEDVARKNLREAISHLRKDLPVADALISSNDFLSIDPQYVYSDILEFRRIVSPFLLMNHSPASSNEVLPGWRVAEFATAVNLCRSNIFLHGLQIHGSRGFQNWVDLTNQTLRIALLRVINAMVDYFISAGDLDAAIVWLRKALDIDPLDFNLNYLTLTCLRDQGLTRQLIEFVNYQENEYREQGETLPEQFRELRTRAEESTRVGIKSSKIDWPVSEKGAARFFGREDELGYLNRLMRRKGALQLRGEAGVGKTRLIQEFFEQQSLAPRLLYFRGHQISQMVPFQVFIEGIQKAIKTQDWELLDTADREILEKFYNHQLSDLQALAGIHPMDGWLPVYETVFYACLRLMEKLALERPVLFVLDDAWWCDLASLTLVGFLLEHDFFKKNGILILVTQLDRKNEPLDQLIIRLKREKKLESITLNNFSDIETKKFVKMMMGIDLDPYMLQQVVLNTGGNPFFLVEAIRSLKYSGHEIGSFSEKDPMPIPEPIQALVQEKMGKLSEPAVKVIKAAAVNGNSFSADVLELMIRMDNEIFLDALDEIRMAGFISVDSNFKPAGGYVFCHDIERAYIENTLEPARCRDLHIKAANAILKRRGKEPEIASRVARHFEIACEFGRAVEFLVYAGEDAQAHASRETAYNMYSRALELVKQNLYRFTPEVILGIINKWADYAYDLDDNETCRQVYRACLDIGYDLKSPLLFGIGASGLGRYSASMANFNSARNYFGHAILQLKKTGNLAELYETYCRMGILEIKLDNYKGATHAFEEGLQHIGELDDDRSLESRINLLTQLGILYCYQGQPVQARRLAMEMANLSMLVRRKSANLQGAAIQMMTLFFNGCYHEVLALQKEYKRLDESPPVREWLSIIDLSIGNASLHLGDLDNAWKSINLAVERETGHPYQKIIDSALESKASIFRLLGEYDKAMELYQVVINSGAKDPPAVECRLNKGITLVQRGFFQEGMVSIDDSIAQSVELGFTSIELSGRITRLLFLQDRLAPEEFERQANLIINEMRQHGIKEAEYLSTLIPARVALMRKDNQEALALFLQLGDQLKTNSNVWMELEVLLIVRSLAGQQTTVKNAANKRLKEILDKINSHATTNPIKGIFNRFRKELLRGPHVNVLSTVKKYK